MLLSPCKTNGNEAVGWVLVHAYGVDGRHIFLSCCKFKELPDWATMISHASFLQLIVAAILCGWRISRRHLVADLMSAPSVDFIRKHGDILR